MRRAWYFANLTLEATSESKGPNADKTSQNVAAAIKVSAVWLGTDEDVELYPKFERATTYVVT